MPRSNENKSCMRVDKSWLDISARTAKTLINSHAPVKRKHDLMRVDQLKVDESRQELAVKLDRKLSSFHRVFGQGKLIK
jgi:hypothetical protein